MAILQQETVTITLSKLVKNDGGPYVPLVTTELAQNLEAIATELLSDSSVLVEAEANSGAESI